MPAAASTLANFTGGPSLFRPLSRLCTCAMSQVDLQLFGYPVIRVDGRLTSLPLRKAMAALTYVVEAQTTVSRDALATLLWPDADEATAHARLRRLLHRMQEHLGVGIIAAG